MSALAAIFDDRAYRKLLSKTLPHVIHTEADSDRALAQLEALHDKGQLTELLTLLIEDFEVKHYQLDPASPVEVVQELMEANGLKQVDLVDMFGTRSLVSEFLSGKRELSKAHIQKFSQRFHVSPEIFFPA